MHVSTYLNVHLVSDSTGETLNAIVRAVAPLFEAVTALEHSYYLVRSRRQLDRVLAEIEASPGVVLFTIASHELRDVLEARCKELGIPSFLIRFWASGAAILGFRPTRKQVQNKLWTRIISGASKPLTTQ
jgi:[pyruvate, water dikinase]-phosphate phosphotransferase / [pyruvate, water dikinase] kinase